MFKTNIDFDQLEFGIYTDIDEVDYHSSPGISKHNLDLINKSPATYRYKLVAPKDDDENKAFIFGGAVHAYVLEQHKFNNHYAVANFLDMRTKAAKQFKEENADKRVLTMKDMATVAAIEQAIRQHDVASILLDKDSGIAEASAYWCDDNKFLWKDEKPTYRLCRCRPDFINTAHNVVIDLKTTLCAGLSLFTRDVVNYRYHVQAAFYVDGLRALGCDVQTFIFIAVEKEAPYNIGIYELSADDLKFGRSLYQRNLKTYSQCLETKSWPGYDKDIRLIELPPWAKRVDIY